MVTTIASGGKIQTSRERFRDKFAAKSQAKLFWEMGILQNVITDKVIINENSVARLTLFGKMWWESIFNFHSFLVQKTVREYFYGRDDDGGETAAAVNAACLALVDCGLPMKCLFADVTVAMDGKGAYDVDPPLARAIKAKALLTFVFKSRADKLLSFHLSGRCSESQMQQAFTVAKDSSQHVFQFYLECLTKKFSKDLALWCVVFVI